MNEVQSLLGYDNKSDWKHSYSNKQSVCTYISHICIPAVEEVGLAILVRKLLI